jgi:hypothetical protein
MVLVRRVVYVPAVRGDAGNHVVVAARWLKQRRCHIDVVAGGGGREVVWGR